MLRGVAALGCVVLLLSTVAPAASAAAPHAAAPHDAAPALTQSGGSISLTVSDGDDPVTGATVTVSRKGERVLSGETSADGRLDTGPLDAGSYTVTVREPGYYERAVSVTVEGSEVQRTVTLDPGSVELSVQAVDGRESEPLADALVEVERVGSVRTAGDGTQTVRVPVNSQLSVSVSKEGYEPASATVVIEEAAESVTLSTTRRPDISLSVARQELDAGETVEATVTDAYGDPVAGAAVLVDGEVVAETNGDGTASVPIETAGEHAVRARAGSTLSDQQTVVASQSADPTPTATADGAATESTATATAAADGANGTATQFPTATPTEGGTESNPFPDVGSEIDLPELDWGAGPLGVLPPFEGPVRIVSVIALVGLVGLLYSVFGSRNL